MEHLILFQESNSKYQFFRRKKKEKKRVKYVKIQIMFWIQTMILVFGFKSVENFSSCQKNSYLYYQFTQY